MADEPKVTGQIREGAGLEESRLNVEFIEWLRKWSSPILFVAAGVFLAMWAWGKFREIQETKVDQAFVELRGASTPEALMDIALVHDRTRSVGSIARLKAASLQKRALLTDVEPAVLAAAPNDDPTVTSLKTDGSLKNPDDALTDEERSARVASAEQALMEVYERNREDPNKWVLTISAMFSLAAIEESRGNWDEARRWYEESARSSESRRDEMSKTIAEKRISTLDLLKAPPRLFDAAALPAVPEPPPEKIEVGGTPTPTDPPAGEQPAGDPAKPADPPEGGEPAPAVPTSGGGGDPATGGGGH